MQVAINRLVLAAGLSLALTALPVAHGEGDDLTVKMNGNFVTADPENLKWAANKSAPYGMQIIMLYGDPTKPGPYVFRAKMPSGYKLPPHKHPDERCSRALTGRAWANATIRWS
jgi:hypothetical protein